MIIKKSGHLAEFKNQSFNTNLTTVYTCPSDVSYAIVRVLTNLPDWDQVYIDGYVYAQSETTGPNWILLPGQQMQLRRGAGSVTANVVVVGQEYQSDSTDETPVNFQTTLTTTTSLVWRNTTTKNVAIRCFSQQRAMAYVLSGGNRFNLELNESSGSKGNQAAILMPPDSELYVRSVSGNVNLRAQGWAMTS